MATIDERGPYQWRVRIRRKIGDKTVTLTHTAESYAAARKWAEINEGKVAGDEYKDRRKAKETTLEAACAWLEKILPNTPDAKNKRSKLKYWRSTDLANWSLLSIRPADLIQWRRDVLDEDNAEDGETVGPGADVGPQTVVHRLNVLSQLFKRWSLAHDQPLTNPVVEGVRPSLPDGRNRRLSPHLDHNGKDEEARLLEACAKSTRKWLRSAVVISLETCMRQSELAGLTWDRVHLGAEYPYCDLPKTKNDRARRVPLSKRAVAAFKELRPVESIIGPAPVLPISTGRGIAHAFKYLVSEDTFPDLRWHDLRHEAISLLFELTDLRDNEIMAISGHLRPEMLTRYTHLRTDQEARTTAMGDKLNSATS
jgi:integrase